MEKKIKISELPDFDMAQYLKSEEDIAATSKGQTAAPIGTMRQAADVPLRLRDRPGPDAN